MLTLKQAEKYCVEIHRHYFEEYRVFRHPNFESALILFKDENLMGMINKKYINNMNAFRYVKTNQVHIEPFEF